ncbi:phosphate ABC transporter substrate-binding protein [Thalassotalea marina]|uniref:Phosphate ABC transporter substrate-binding protein n=1 Tax=Thalassotalea marina TaxID=1673741 RepID=A0A919BGW6_9GAMM|nr:phosphate ABC transporter substrate-binding protein [Thalassotalea marina]GHF88394.1 hypothetical protein GCM10017161_15130 [Thalassotalea marina]
MKRFKQSLQKVMPLFISLSLLYTGNVSADVAVVVHPSNNSEFDETIIKKTFLGKSKSFSNGKSTILIGLSSTDDITQEFNRKVIGKSSSQVKAYWSKILFTGKGTPPQELDSSALVLQAVASNQDAIGYLDPSVVDDSVKVVATF